MAIRRIQRVTEAQSSPARVYAEKILAKLQEEMSTMYKFQFRLVGSAKYNTILTDNNGWFDLDYQILLTSNSHMYKENKLSNATQIKSDFFYWFNRKFSTNQNFKVENSTTAITLRNISGKYSIDFVIIRLYPQNNEIIRRNNQKNVARTEYTWNQLSSRHNDAYAFFNNLSGNEKNELIENYILPRKADEKRKSPSDPTFKTSTDIFIEEVINYAHRIK